MSVNGPRQNDLHGSHGDVPFNGDAPLASPEVERCVRCLRPLTRRGARGECLRCAVYLALTDGSDTDALEHVAPQDVDPSSSLPLAPAPVHLRYSHFEVAMGADGEPVELGRGAMATTYRATDTTLRLPVALKVISRHVAGRPAARARFLREARAAARLHHPNVASVTFHGEQDGECFYAMELVEGETLAERVRRSGPFTPAQALEVGVQVARALAAAEALGVVHRDLKPSNLMLVDVPGAPGSRDGATDLHVKVIDWGLAKAFNAAADPSLGADQTRDAFVGTPAFASPEQFARGAGSAERRVDTRSDIYSLGVTLWFLVCGKTPFVGDTLEAIHARQLILPTEQLKVAKVPASLTSVLTRMLAFDPAARPQSARELLDLLRHAQARRGGGEAWMERRRILGWRLVAAAVLVTALAAGAVWWRRQHGVLDTPQVTAADRPAIAVLPFENNGSNEADAFFTTGVQDEITSDLAYVAALRVIGADSTRSYLPAQRDLPKIGAELGVRYLLEGSVRREGNQFGINVRLVDLRDPGRPWSARYNRPTGEVFAVQSEIIHAVTEHLRVAPSDAERVAIDRPPTTSPAAYDLYLKVHEQMPLLQSYQESERYYRETMAPTLERAVALDPDFAFAYCDLATAYLNLSSYEINRDQAEAAAKHRAQAEAALVKARTLRPDAGQVHQAQAAYLMDYVGNNELTRHELELARRALPNNAAVEHTMGVLAQRQSRWDEAVTCFERALSLDPRNTTQRWNLTVLYRELRRYEEADRELARVIDATPAATSTAYRLNLTISRIEAQADLTPFRQALDAIVPINESSGDTINRARVMLAVFSHDPETISRLLATNRTELLYDLLPAPRAWFEALGARMRHNEAEAEAAFRTARMEVEHTLQLDPTNSMSLGLLAIIDAGLGRADEAVREAKHACEMGAGSVAGGQFAPLTVCNLAVVYAWTGQPDLACETLEPWITRPAGLVWPMQPTYGDFRLNPVWDPMRGYPRFEALVARLAPPPAR